MQSLAECVEAVYAVASSATSDDDSIMVLQQHVEALVRSLDTITINDDVVDEASAEVVTQAIRVLSVLLHDGREEQSKTDVCALLWKSYGKFLKKFTDFVDEDSAQYFMDAVIGHSTDGILHISSIAADPKEDLESCYKVLSFFAQRLALSFLWIPRQHLHAKAAEGFHVLIGFLGLQEIGASTKRIKNTSNATKQTVLKAFFKAVEDEDPSAQRSLNTEILMEYHDHSMKSLKSQSELRVEVLHGYRSFFVALFESWGASKSPSSQDIDFSLPSEFHMLQLLSRYFCTVAALAPTVTNPEATVAGLNAIVTTLAHMIFSSPTDDTHYMLDWFLLQSICIGHVHNLEEEEVAVWTTLIRNCLFALLKQIPSLPVENIKKWARWKMQYAHRAMDYVIQCFEELYPSPHYHAEADPYPSIDRLVTFVIELLLFQQSYLSDVILKRISESFIWFVLSPSKDLSKSGLFKHRPLPVALLERILTRLPVKQLLSPSYSIGGVSSTVQSLLQQAASWLQNAYTNPNTTTGGTTGTVTLPAVEALCYALVHAALDMKDAPPVTFFASDQQLRSFSTRVMQYIRTLTAQMQLYAKQLQQQRVATSRSGVITNFQRITDKTRDWIRHIAVLIALFGQHPKLPKGVQHLLAESLTRIVLFWKELVDAQRWIQSSGSAGNGGGGTGMSLTKTRQLLNEVNGCLLAYLRLLALQPVAMMSENTAKELKYALQELAVAMKHSEGSLSLAYSRLGGELMEMTKVSTASWIASFFNGPDGDTWRHLFQLSVQYELAYEGHQALRCYLEEVEAFPSSSSTSASSVSLALEWPMYPNDVPTPVNTVYDTCYARWSSWLSLAYPQIATATAVTRSTTSATSEPLADAQQQSVDTACPYTRIVMQHLWDHWQQTRHERSASVLHIHASAAAAPVSPQSSSVKPSDSLVADTAGSKRPVTQLQQDPPRSVAFTNGTAHSPQHPQQPDTTDEPQLKKHRPIAESDDIDSRPLSSPVRESPRSIFAQTTTSSMGTVDAQSETMTTYDEDGHPSQQLPPAVYDQSSGTHEDDPWETIGDDDEPGRPTDKDTPVDPWSSQSSSHERPDESGKESSASIDNSQQHRLKSQGSPVHRPPASQEQRRSLSGSPLHSTQLPLPVPPPSSQPSTRIQVAASLISSMVVDDFYGSDEDSADGHDVPTD